MQKLAPALRTGLGIGLALAWFCIYGNSVHAQSFTSTYRLTGKSLRATVTPTRPIIKKDNAFRLEWQHISKTPVILISANDEVGPYMILRRTGESYECFGQGKIVLEHIKRSKIEIAYKDDFDPEKPFVLRWVNTKYEAENEDFEVEKMFKVAYELYFLQYRPRVTKTGTTHPMSYNDAEILNSFAFPKRKHRTWKGVQE